MDSLKRNIWMEKCPWGRRLLLQNSFRDIQYDSYCWLSAGLEMNIALDKREYQIHIFLISPQKHTLWVFIRSASSRRFEWVSQRIFSWRNKKNINNFWSKIESYPQLWMNDVKQKGNLWCIQSKWPEQTVRMRSQTGLLSYSTQLFDNRM